MKLEVVVLGVSDVDRAKAFYENLGWRLDADFATGDFHVVQLTPHHSEASIIFGKGITSAKSGSADSLILAVDDIDAARDDLIARGVDVSEVFHYAGPLVRPLGAGSRSPGGAERSSSRSRRRPFRLDTVAAEITALVRGFVGSSRLGGRENGRRNQP